MFNIKQSHYQARPTLVIINSGETLFYPFTVSFNKWGGSYYTIGDPYARVCVPNKVNNMNVKVFILMSVVNETRFLVQHESCECKCGLNESVCNSKQKWNPEECRWECKKLDDYSSCYCFDDIKKIEDFDFDNILSDEKLHENILVYDISYKTLIGAKQLRIRFSKVDGLIRVYDIKYYLALKNMMPFKIGLYIL